MTFIYLSACYFMVKHGYFFHFSLSNGLHSRIVTEQFIFTHIPILNRITTFLTSAVGTKFYIISLFLHLEIVYISGTLISPPCHQHWNSPGACSALYPGSYPDTNQYNTESHLYGTCKYTKCIKTHMINKAQIRRV